MKRAAIAYEHDNKSRRTEVRSKFAQEIIGIIVHHVSDGLTLNNLCKVSPFWEHAVLKKSYSKVFEYDFDKIIRKQHLANYATKLDFFAVHCNRCCQLKKIQFPNLKEVHLYHVKCCDNIQQFFGQNTSFHHLYMPHTPPKACLDILQSIINAREQNPIYQPLLSYHGPLDKSITTCLHKLNTQEIAASINSEDIARSFTEFNDLQCISLFVVKYEEDDLIEGLQYLNKFKTLSSFKINRIRSEKFDQSAFNTHNNRLQKFSQNVFNTLVANVLKPNAPTLQEVEISHITGLLKLPRCQKWPKLKKLTIQDSSVCPVNLIRFCEKAPNIQHISVNCIDKQVLMRIEVDLPIKIINALQNLSFMRIYSNGDYYQASCAEIRYIRRQSVDEKFQIQNQGMGEILGYMFFRADKTETKFFELKKQYNKTFFRK